MGTSVSWTTRPGPKCSGRVSDKQRSCRPTTARISKMISFPWVHEKTKERILFGFQVGGVLVETGEPAYAKVFASQIRLDLQLQQLLKLLLKKKKKSILIHNLLLKKK